MKRILLLSALMVAAACAKPKAPAPVAQPLPAPAPVRPAAAPVMMDPVAPEVVLDKLHVLDGQLIDASKLAEKDAHNRKVKTLAKEMLAARQKDDAAVVALASKLSVTLKDPAQLSIATADKAELTAHHDAFAQLGGKSGPAFDADFLQSIDGALKSELSLLSQVDGKASNADLKAFAQKLEPQVTAREAAAARELKAASPASRGG